MPPKKKASKAFGAVKANGVICVYDGCYKVMTTQKWQEHFAAHLAAGETVTIVHRQQYERSMLDARLLDLAPDSALKAITVASLTHISHALDEICARLQMLEVSPVTAPLPGPVVGPAREATVPDSAEESEASEAESEKSAVQESENCDDEASDKSADEGEGEEAPASPPSPPKAALRRSPRKRACSSE